jgi:hypothetical protein
MVMRRWIVDYARARSVWIRGYINDTIDWLFKSRQVFHSNDSRYSQLSPMTHDEYKSNDYKSVTATYLDRHFDKAKRHRERLNRT